MIIRMVHQITVLEALFLGLLQGFTEWLPVSSSGHLVIFQSLLGISVPPDFDILIMAGTIAALILYFRKKISSLFRGVLAGDRSSVTYVALIVLSGFPTAVIGFDFKIFFKSLFGQPFIVSLLIIVTGLFLFLASRKKENTGEVNPLQCSPHRYCPGHCRCPGHLAVRLNDRDCTPAGGKTKGGC